MRTTIEIDDKLFARAMRKVPRGTSKRALIEEALRVYVSGDVITDRPTFGVFDHVHIGVHDDFDAPVPGFPGPEDEP